MSEPINRLDPQWGMFAAAYVSGPWHPEMAVSPQHQYKPSEVADFADAMIRERDRRCAEDNAKAAPAPCNCDELREAAKAVLAYYYDPLLGGGNDRHERLRKALGEQS